MNKSLAVLSVIGIIFFSGCNLIDNLNSLSPPKEIPPMTISTSVYPLELLTREISGDTIDIATILPKNTDPKIYTLSKENLTQLKNSTITLGIGHGLDTWISEAQKVDPEMNIIILDQHIDIHIDEYTDEENPYYWLSSFNTEEIIYSIRDILIDQDPKQTTFYEENAERLLQKISDQSERWDEQMMILEDKQIIVCQNIWSYLKEEYGFETYTLEHNPSTSSIQYIFDDPFCSTEQSDAIVYTLDPIGQYSNAQNYIELIDYNVQTLINAHN
ncbi:zinc ABC transporter substrate-binding protein [Patescibacteria group bacterium]|nr:zinc ABC transporter substrate-binding protein [Patescibacteria group bacterium]MBU1722029.1 zinc ABC transporter substrate-binding protein [Patescibacteria group bacterium]MBU1901221.1 zinc ABC transporter substrate-binding protein [Patescibacteria group bacterium]